MTKISKSKLSNLESFADVAAWPIQGLVRHFRDEIEDRIKAKRVGRVSAMAAE